MCNITKRILLSLLISVTNTLLFADNGTALRIDEKAFVAIDACTNIDTAIKQGINTFVFNLKQEGDQFQFIRVSKGCNLERNFLRIKQYAESPTHLSINIIVTGSLQDEAIKPYLKKRFGDNLYFFQNEEDGTTKNNTLKIRCFLPKDVVSFSKADDNPEAGHGMFSADPAGKMVFLDASAICPDSLTNVAIRKWEKTGRIPNFILVPDNNLKKAQESVAKLNKLRRFRGQVKFNGKLLNNIYWKQLPGIVTPGCFSFPITDYSIILSPYKNGYLITPGEIIHHTSMADVVRPFIAYGANFNDGLVYSFSFDQNERNDVEPQNKNSIINAVKWISDKARGDVASFDTLNAFIDYKNPNLLNFSTPISISVWLKPEQLKEYMGIIGVGTSFSIKLKGGFPCFTTAQIKDHVAPQCLPKNNWSHVGFVFNPGGDIEFYINGQKNGTMKASDIIDSRQSLVIGNNIWGEQYFGCIDKLMIWDRGLSGPEFQSLYKKQLHPKKQSGHKLRIPLFVLVCAALFLFLKNKTKKSKTTTKQNTHRPIASKNSSTANPGIYTNKIETFGKLNVVSQEKGNITKNFSPLLKQLLSFFILKTVFAEERGATTKEINDTFWPGFSKEQAKDNRGTNIKKLRKILQLLPDKGYPIPKTKNHATK